MQMQGGLSAFCEKYGVNGKLIKLMWKLQLCAEELTQEIIARRLNDDVDMDVSVEYSELSGGVKLCCAYRGKADNPLGGDTDSDNLGVTIVKNTAKMAEHTYTEGLNKLMIVL